MDIKVSVRESEGDAYVVDLTGEIDVYTSPKVKDAITAAHVAVEAAEITHIPTNTVPVDAEVAQKILKLIDTLEDNEDVQSVSHNAEIPESVLT